MIKRHLTVTAAGKNASFEKDGDNTQQDTSMLGIMREGTTEPGGETA
jgi:hypothetical protein